MQGVPENGSIWKWKKSLVRVGFTRRNACCQQIRIASDHRGVVHLEFRTPRSNRQSGTGAHVRTCTATVTGFPQASTASHDSVVGQRVRFAACSCGTEALRTAPRLDAVGCTQHDTEA